VVIAAARNGAFSGKIAVSNAKTRAAQVSDLRAGTAVIPVESVLIRYGVPWPAEFGSELASCIDLLLESPPEKVPADAEVWLTVNVRRMRRQVRLPAC